MSDGIWVVDGNGLRSRPTSKKQVKELAAREPNRLVIEHTSLHGDDPPEEHVHDLRVGRRIYFVGPDPYTSRKFYGTIEHRRDGRVVVQ